MAKKDDAIDDAPLAMPPVEEEAPAPSDFKRAKGGPWKEPANYIGHDEAQTYYVELGNGRTLSRVLKWMEASGRPHPTWKTLKGWQHKKNWSERARLYDHDVAVKADDRIKHMHAVEGAEAVVSLASDFRKLSGKIVKRLSARIDKIQVKSGGEAKAMAEAAVALNRAAEVLDGGVGDRTEHRETMTIEQRQHVAASMVDDIFKNVRTNNDNKKSAEPAVGDAVDARRSANSV